MTAYRVGDVIASTVDELPVGSVVVDADGDAWQSFQTSSLGRPRLRWRMARDSNDGIIVSELGDLAATFGPVKIVYIPAVSVTDAGVVLIREAMQRRYA